MSTTSAFTYEPLASETRQIRLCKLDTSDNSAETTSLRHHIEHFDFDASPEYIALSYVWGAESPTSVIAVNDGLFEVRQNLFQFLQRAKQSERISSKYFWIDQLCINQNDLDERASQVRMMGEIYESAAETISWLTTSDERCGALAYQGPFSSLLLRDPYFTRLWIVQEIFFSRRITIMTSRYEWEWYGEEMSEALGSLKSILGTLWWEEEESVKLLLIIMRVERLQKLRRLKTEREQDTEIDQWNAWYYEQKLDLAGILENYADLVCSDPRDKVYALISLVPPAYRVPVDYTLTTMEIFERAVKTPSPYWCLDEDANYLGFCAHLFKQMELQHGPSIMFKLALRNNELHVPFTGYIKSANFLEFAKEYRLGRYNMSAAKQVERLAQFTVSKAQAENFSGKRIRICPHEDGLTYDPYDPRNAHLLPSRDTKPTTKHRDVTDNEHQDSGPRVESDLPLGSHISPLTRGCGAGSMSHGLAASNTDWPLPALSGRYSFQ